MFPVVSNSPRPTGCEAFPTRTPDMVIGAPTARSSVGNFCFAGTSVTRETWVLPCEMVSPFFRSASAIRTLSRESSCRTFCMCNGNCKAAGARASLDVEAPESLRSSAEYAFERFARILVEEIDDESHHLRVPCSNLAHRPIGTDHQALRAKSLQGDFEIGREVLWLPGVPVGFGDHARQLAEDVGKLRELASVRGPRLSGLCLDQRLRQVIEHEELARETLNKFDRNRQVSRENQDVVCEMKLL